MRKKERNLVQMHNRKYQCHMAACCTYQLPIYFCYRQNRSHTKTDDFLTKNIAEFFWGKKSGEWAGRQKKKDQREKATGLGRKKRKKKRRDSKVESNDSSKIPDGGGGEVDRYLDLPSGV